MFRLRHTNVQETLSDQITLNCPVVADIRHPVTSLSRDQRRGHDDAVMPHLDKLAIQAVSKGSCLRGHG